MPERIKKHQNQRRNNQRKSMKAGEEKQTKRQ